MTELYNGGQNYHPLNHSQASALVSWYDKESVTGADTIEDKGPGGVDLTMFNMDSSNLVAV